MQEHPADTDALHHYDWLSAFLDLARDPEYRAFRWFAQRKNSWTPPRILGVRQIETDHYHIVELGAAGELIHQHLVRTQDTVRVQAAH